jgi:hypothetical protein
MIVKHFGREENLNFDIIMQEIELLDCKRIAEDTLSEVKNLEKMRLLSPFK